LLILAVVGITDDLLEFRRYSNGSLKVGGLSNRFRIFLAFVASIPLVVINAGHHVVNIAFLGPVNIGLIYPLLLIPLGIAGATTTYNFLAGFNGLEAGQGIIILSFLSFVSYTTGSAWLAVVGLCMVGALVGFYVFNKNPARVFPGDSLTYSIGALIAIMAILGNFERIAVFVFIPYIIETILKSRGRLKKSSFGIAKKDGGLEMPYDKIYGMTHFSIWFLSKFKKKVSEKDVVYFIFSIQILICLLALVLFRGVLLF
jgi:UDP-N-acetylglucosamine--dolichyl-phosphate N-acetylglucosaminephosphotransferase